MSQCSKYLYCSPVCIVTVEQLEELCRARKVVLPPNNKTSSTQSSTTQTPPTSTSRGASSGPTAPSGGRLDPAGQNPQERLLTLEDLVACRLTRHDQERGAPGGEDSMSKYRRHAIESSILHHLIPPPPQFRRGGHSK